MVFALSCCDCFDCCTAFDLSGAEVVEDAPRKISSKSSSLNFLTRLPPLRVALSAGCAPLLPSTATTSSFPVPRFFSFLLFIQSSFSHHEFLSLSRYRSAPRKSTSRANLSRFPCPSPPPMNSSRATSSPCASARHSSRQSMATVEPLDSPLTPHEGGDNDDEHSNAILSERSYPSEKVISRASMGDDDASEVRNNTDSLRTSSGIEFASSSPPPPMEGPCPSRSTSLLIPSGAIISCSRSVPGLADSSDCRICRDSTRAYTDVGAAGESLSDDDDDDDEAQRQSSRDGVRVWTASATPSAPTASWKCSRVLEMCSARRFCRCPIRSSSVVVPPAATPTAMLAADAGAEGGGRTADSSSHAATSPPSTSISPTRGGALLARGSVDDDTRPHRARRADAFRSSVSTAVACRSSSSASPRLRSSESWSAFWDGLFAFGSPPPPPPPPRWLDDGRRRRRHWTWSCSSESRQSVAVDAERNRSRRTSTSTLLAGEGDDIVGEGAKAACAICHCGG